MEIIQVCEIYMEIIQVWKIYMPDGRIPGGYLFMAEQRGIFGLAATDSFAIN